MVPPLRAAYGYSAAQTQWVFGLTIASFTLTMIGAGRLLYLWGPRLVAMTGGLLFAAGYLTSAVAGHSFAGLLAGSGLLAGAGIGFGYVSPLAMVIASFPGRKGLAGGIAVAGFGGGAILTSWLVAAALEGGSPLSRVFRGLGFGFGLLIVGASFLLRRPAGPPAARPPDLHPAQLWKDAYLRLLFIGMFCGTFAGLLLVGNLKPIGLSEQIAPATATLAISLFALGNAAGRIAWGWWSDRSGFPVIRWSLVLLAVGALGLLPARAHGVLFLAVSMLVGFGFGACFSVYASLVAARYGAAHVGGLYPLVFLSYGLAGILGPTLGGYLYDVSGTYLPAILLAAATAAAGAVLARPTAPAPRG